MKIFKMINTKNKILVTVFAAALFFPMLAVGQGLIIQNPGNMPAGSITNIFTMLLNWLLGIFAVLGVVGFVIAGIIYLVSTGDETAIARAKSAMIYSIVGIIVGLSGFLLMQAIVGLLGGGTSTF